jgi:hypothetical protein
MKNTKAREEKNLPNIKPKQNNPTGYKTIKKPMRDSRKDANFFIVVFVIIILHIWHHSRIARK